MAEKEEKVTQLPLSVEVSPWSGLKYSYGKFFREFKYSPFVQVVTHLLFWVNLSLVAITYWFLEQHRAIVQAGRGVLIVPASRSPIAEITMGAVSSLTALPYLWWGLLAIFIVTMIVAMILYWGGRAGIIPYILAIALLLLVLVAKTVLNPILLLGG